MRPAPQKWVIFWLRMGDYWFDKPFWLGPKIEYSLSVNSFLFSIKVYLEAKGTQDSDLISLMNTLPVNLCFINNEIVM